MCAMCILRDQDNWNQGRRRSVWVTTHWTLWHDSLRDLNDVGGSDIPLISLETGNLSQLDSFDEGVLFVTYKFLTRRLKSAKCGACHSPYIPCTPASFGEADNIDPSATCQSCKEVDISFVCTQRCKASYICERCHSLLLAPRVKAISDWMKGGDSDGDGVLALDESHKAKIATTVTASGVCVSHNMQHKNMLQSLCR